MECERCAGLMVVEDCLDYKGSEDAFWIKAFRCIICGNLVDHLITRNRSVKLAEVIPLHRKGIRRAPRTPVARLTA